MGAEPPWSSGRESRGDRLEIGPLWRVFAFFRRAAKEGRSRRSDTTSVQTPVPVAAGKTPVPVIAKPRKGLWQSVFPVPAAAGNTPGYCGFAVCLCNLFPCPVASGGPLSLSGKERGERNRQREPRRRTGEWPVSGFWPNTGKIPPAPPLQIETQGFDLRRTFRRNLQAATKGSCAVFRRIRTRNPSPSARGLRPP